MLEKDLIKVQEYLEKYKNVNDEEVNDSVAILSLLKNWNDKKIDDATLVKDLQIHLESLGFTTLFIDDEIEDDKYELAVFSYYLSTKVAIKLVKTQADIEFYNNQVANCYFFGFGVEPNYQKAFEIYLKYFEKKDYAQAGMLANFFENGYYVGENQEIAERLNQFANDYQKLLEDYVVLRRDINAQLEKLKNE